MSKPPLTLDYVSKVRLRTKKNRFRFQEELGTGRFSTVYKVVHRPSNSTVVLKRLDPLYADEVHAVAEIRRHRKLSHPHIIGFYGFFTNSKNNVFLLLHFAENGNMEEYLLEKGKLQEDEAKRLMKQLCLAVEFCHGKKVVHREIKPNCILLDDGFNCRLSDFGFYPHMKRPRRTFYETALYLSPEMLHDINRTSPSMDVWGVGVVSYEIVDGSHPFTETGAPLEILERIESATYKNSPNFSPLLRNFLQNVLVADPSKRENINVALTHPWINNSNSQNAVLNMENSTAPKAGDSEATPISSTNLMHQNPAVEPPNNNPVMSGNDGNSKNDP